MINVCLMFRSSVARAIVGSALAAAGGAGCAAAAAPFQAFEGAWTGGGKIVDANGVAERIRCRANGAPAREGKALSQSIVCASASYRLDIESYVEASGATVEGNWRETTRAIGGHLTGRIAGGRFQGAVNGSGFAAEISLDSNGRTQRVNIQPHGGQVADVSIQLERME